MLCWRACREVFSHADEVDESPDATRSTGGQRIDIAVGVEIVAAGVAHRFSASFIISALKGVLSSWQRFWLLKVLPHALGTMSCWLGWTKFARLRQPYTMVYPGCG
jgi:hypothetical protein